MRQDFTKQYDVAVFGAGIGGIAAALAAARRGHKVCLVEKQTMIGGLATSGMIFIYLPLCDGEDHQVTFGIAEELLLAGRKYGPYDISERWGGDAPPMDEAALSEGAVKENNIHHPRDRYAVNFTPAGLIIAMDSILQEAGVDLWLDTLLCDAVVEDGKVTGAFVENVSGRGLIKAGAFVDSTGDCTLIRRAGGAVDFGTNRNSPWFLEYQKGNNGFYSLGDPVIMKTLSSGVEGDTLYCRSGKDNTSFIRDAWKIIRERYDALYKEDPSAKRSVYPLAVPAMAQYRKIARIQGKSVIRTGEFNCHREDSIGMTGDWRCAGKIWETPYGALLPHDLDGVLAAGRCIASDGDSWEAYRVIPAAAMTGEAAGVAAALSVERGESVHDLNLEVIRAELRKNNFRFHREEVL